MPDRIFLFINQYPVNLQNIFSGYAVFLILEQKTLTHTSCTVFLKLGTYFGLISLDLIFFNLITLF